MPQCSAPCGSQRPSSSLQLPGSDNFTWLAFDPNWNLWVSVHGANQVRMFTQAQLAAGGAQTPTVTLSVPTAGPLAFDASGNLWVEDEGDSIVYAYAPIQSPPGSPIVLFSVQLPMRATFMMFDPHPGNVPLNGSRVAPRRAKTVTSRARP